MSDQTPGQTPGAAPTPEPATPAVDTAARTAELEAKLRDFQVREGRFRNEKGVMQARIRELEQLALSNSSGQNYSDPTPSYTPDPAGYQPQPQATYVQPDVVTKDEFDLYRFQRDHADRFDAVRKVAMDGNQIGNFVRYRVDSWGRPIVGPDGRAVADIYATYSAINTHLEAEELRSKLNPNRNPALATISGSGASSDSPAVEMPEDPEEIRKMFPEAFAPQNNPWGSK